MTPAAPRMALLRVAMAPAIRKCGTSTIGNFLANTNEAIPLPANLRVPGAVYCADADCTNQSIQNSLY